jgi:hypothetical protein
MRQGARIGPPPGSSRAGLIELGHEGRVLRGAQPLLDNGKGIVDLAPNQCGQIEPEPGEHRATYDAVVTWKQWLEAIFAEHKPIDPALVSFG